MNRPVWLATDSRNDLPPPMNAGFFCHLRHPERGGVSFFGSVCPAAPGKESAVSFLPTDAISGITGAWDLFPRSSRDNLSKLKGYLAIGHVRYSTTGSSTLANRPALFGPHARNIMPLAKRQLTNTQACATALEDRGSIFQSTMDTEVFITLMAPPCKYGLEEALVKAFLPGRKGAYSAGHDDPAQDYAARDPGGFVPFVLVKLTAAGWCLGNLCHLDLVGASYIRDIKPGRNHHH